MQIPDNPFYIVAFAPFLSAEAAGKQGAARLLSVQSVDQGLAALRPSLYIPLPKALSPDRGITLEFVSLADFEPDAIVARTPWMRALRDGRGLGAGKGMASEAEKSLDSIFDMVELPGKRGGSRELPVAEGNEADAIISGALNRIFSDDDFQRMEAAWQGVALLFEEAGADRLHLEIVPVARETAAEALESSARQLDAAPPDLILVDAPFDSTPVGMQLLEAAATLAERLMSPAVCWCGPDFLHLDAWPGLEALPYLPNHLDGFSFARWKALRARPAAFWTTAACNRLLLKPPSGEAPSAGMSGRAACLAPVWAVAALILQSYARSGTPLGLSAQLLRLRDAPVDTGMPLEAAISDDRAHQLVASGLLPLMPSGSGSGIRLAEAVTINGEPVVSSLILSTLIHSLICLREIHGPSDDAAVLAAELCGAFALHPRFKGALPDGAIIFEAAGNGDGSVVLGVTLKKRPSGAKNIEFTFVW